MLLPEEIHAFTRAVPFRPFRVTVSNGEEFDIHHPDMILATFGMAYIARPRRGDHGDAYGTVAHVSLQHVVKIEPLTAEAKAPVDKSTV